MKIFATINGENKEFNSVETFKNFLMLQQVYSIDVSVQDGNAYYHLSFLSVCYLIVTGELPEYMKTGEK